MPRRDGGHDQPAAAFARPAIHLSFSYVTPCRIFEAQGNTVPCPDDTLDAQILGEGFMPDEVTLSWDSGKVLEKLLILEQKFSLHF